MLRLTDFDDCIVGVVERFGQNAILCYSYEAVIRQLMKEGMTEEEAVEFYHYNQVGAYVGEDTPCFLHPYNPE